MKARVKETGEILDIEFDCTKDVYHKVEYFRTSDGRIMPITAFEFEKFIDWEQRRYEIAKAAMNGILSDEDEVGYACSEARYKEREKHTIPKAVAQFAVACADALIEELKKGGGNE